MLKNKKGIIFGIANDHSIAWGIAKTLSDHGASIALTYQGDTLKKRVQPLAQSIKSEILILLFIKSKMKDKVNISSKALHCFHWLQSCI